MFVLLGAMVSCDKDNDNKNEDQYIKPDVTQSEFTDPRDNYTYQCIEVNGQVWMAENYRYLPKGASIFGVYSYHQDPPGSTKLVASVVVSALNTAAVKKEIPEEIRSEILNCFTYDNATAMEVLTEFYDEIPKIFYEQTAIKNVLSPFDMEYYKVNGALYTLEAAKKFAPEGWRLPTDEDWAALERSLGMPDHEIEKFEEWRGNGFGRALKSGNEGIGFNALYAGMKTSNNTGGLGATSFYNYGSKAYFWSSSVIRPNELDTYAITRSVYNKNDAIMRSTSIIRNIAYSVRYIKKTDGE